MHTYNVYLKDVDFGGEHVHMLAADNADEACVAVLHDWMRTAISNGDSCTRYRVERRAGHWALLVWRDTGDVEELTAHVY